MGLLLNQKGSVFVISEQGRKLPEVNRCIDRFGESLSILLFQYIESFYDINSPYFTIVPESKRKETILRSLFPDIEINGLKEGNVFSKKERAEYHSFLEKMTSSEFLVVIDIFKEVSMSVEEQIYYACIEKISEAMECFKSVKFDKDDIDGMNKVCKTFPEAFGKLTSFSEELKKKVFDKKSVQKLKGSQQTLGMFEDK